MTRPSAAELVERFGSPLFVYDADVIRDRWNRLRASLPDRVDIYYAVKANSSLGILALLRSLGAGAEIASVGELQAVQAASFDTRNVLFAGPGKRTEEIREALQAGVRVHGESQLQVEQIAACARSMGQSVSAGIRVHVPWGAEEEHTIIGGGGASKFGIARETALAQAATWAALDEVRLEGIHVFNASNVLDADALVEGARQTMVLASDLRSEGLPIRFVDIGGGLGVPYAEGVGPLDVERFGTGLARLLEEFDDRLPGVRLAIEPGRYLVSEAGEYYATVLDRKTSGDTEFLILDGGIQNLLRPALVGQQHAVRHAQKEGGELRRYRIAGPLCTSLDDFGQHALPETRVGEILALQNAGAYGFTESMLRFLSHPVPAEVLREGEEVHLLRPRQPSAAHLEDQEIPSFLR